MALVTLEDFAGFIRRDLDAADAYTAAMLLDGASELVTEYCGWHIAPSRADTLTADGSGVAIQPLPTLYMTELTALSESGTELSVDSVDWSVQGVLEKQSGGSWTGRRRGIVAEITHGFEEVPKWLGTLVCAIAGRALATPLGVTQESAGGESIGYATPYLVPPGAVALLDLEKRMLDRIAVPTVA